jgi:hypothetical protein
MLPLRSQHPGLNLIVSLADRALRVVGVSALFLLAGCVEQGDLCDEPSLKSSFRKVMNFDVPPAVSVAKAAYYKSRDSYKMWLYFECDGTTISRIRKLDGGRSRTEAGFTYLNGDYHADVHEGARPDAPAWWDRAVDPASLEQITIGQFPLNRNSAVTDIWIDAKRNVVYARRVEWVFPFEQGVGPMQPEKSSSGS